MFVPSKIIIHHSATKDAGTVDWLQIRKYHVDPPPDGHGWRDIGYHAGVERIEQGVLEHYEVLYGRMWNWTGGHTIGENETSLGICFIGNFSLAPPTDEMLHEGSKLIAMWTQLFEIPVEEIYPHSHFNSTECPGLLFDLDKLKSFVRSWI